jgi:predicted nuclease of restriction endonuclease-like (RecB) superfamily
VRDIQVRRTVLDVSKDIESTAEYAELLESIKQTLAAGRTRAARMVNNVLIETYWQIGREINERRQEHGWGAHVVDRLSADLRVAYPGVRGMSPRNLRYMGTLAARWPTSIGQQAAAQLPWGHVMVILDSCPDHETSEFYAQRSVTEAWSRGMLQTMITTRLHDRVKPALTTFDRTIPEADREVVKDLIRDPYILDFLHEGALPERDLREALIANLIRFLSELGVGFAFIGTEVPVRCGDGEYRIDLLFYHCKLHRYVVVELKVDKFQPEYIGKLNFYVQLIEEQRRDQARDEETLGILLCVGRDDVKVEVALRGVSTPLAVSEWRSLPEEVRHALPSADDIARTVARARREVETANSGLNSA